jgi:hypothetical protein
MTPECWTALALASNDFQTKMIELTKRLPTTPPALMLVEQAAVSHEFALRVHALLQQYNPNLPPE